VHSPTGDTHPFVLFHPYHLFLNKLGFITFQVTGNSHSHSSVQRFSTSRGSVIPQSTIFWEAEKCHKPWQQTCSGVVSFLNRAIDPTRILLQHRLSTGSQTSSGMPLLWWVFHGLQVAICSTVDLHGLQGHCPSHHGLFHRLQGNLCSGAWRTSFPPSSLTLVSAEFLSDSLTPLFDYSCAGFFPFLKYIVTDGLSHGQRWVCLGDSGIGFIGHRGSFEKLFTEATSVTPPLPKLCHANPVQHDKTTYTIRWKTHNWLPRFFCSF